MKLCENIWLLLGYDLETPNFYITCLACCSVVYLQLHYMQGKITFTERLLHIRKNSNVMSFKKIYKTKRYIQKNVICKMRIFSEHVVNSLMYYKIIHHKKYD